MNLNTSKPDLESLTKGKGFYNQKMSFIYSFISGISLSVAQIMLMKTKPYIHHSIDTIYVSLALTLVMPSFVLVDYSVYPTKFAVSGSELGYYVLSGLMTWCFHS